MTRNTERGDRSDGISLKPLIRRLYGDRRRVASAVAASMLLFGIVGLMLFFRAPVERTATLQFRPLFEGADQGKYPNGTPFSSADILATPVLSQVFEANDLLRFGTFQDFRNALFVVQSNPEIDLLAYEYQSKLSDPKLTPVDRARIEEEFRKKRETLPMGYALSFRRSEGATRMPQDLMSKVLDDVLSTWATQAAERRGVLKYNVSVLSKNILPPGSLETEDYIVLVDILRSKILRTLENIGVIAGLPGASVMRTKEQNVSLAEVRANLEDVLRFKVQPLIGLIRSTGLSKDPELAILYLENQLFQNKLEADQASGNVRTLQASLRQYMQEGQSVGAQPAAGEQQPGQSPIPGIGVTAMIPQFGESFLDRLSQMATQNSDVEFRQDITERIITEGVKAVALEKDTAYYEDLLGALRGALRRGGSPEQVEGRARAAELVEARAKETLNDLTRALDRVNAIYTDLSAHNLNANALLYQVTAPFTVRTTRALSLQTLAIAGLLVLVLATVLSSAGVLAYGYMRREIIDAPAADAARTNAEKLDRPVGRRAEGESPDPAVVGYPGR